MTHDPATPEPNLMRALDSLLNRDNDPARAALPAETVETATRVHPEILRNQIAEIIRAAILNQTSTTPPKRSAAWPSDYKYADRILAICTPAPSQTPRAEEPRTVSFGGIPCAPVDGHDGEYEVRLPRAEASAETQEERSFALRHLDGVRALLRARSLGSYALDGEAIVSLASWVDTVEAALRGALPSPQGEEREKLARAFHEWDREHGWHADERGWDESNEASRGRYREHARLAAALLSRTDAAPLDREAVEKKVADLVERGHISSTAAAEIRALATREAARDEVETLTRYVTANAPLRIPMEAAQPRETGERESLFACGCCYETRNPRDGCPIHGAPESDTTTGGEQ